MKLLWMQAFYGLEADMSHMAVADVARSALLNMAQEMEGRTDQLIAIYVPEGTDEIYQPGLTRGRVIGAIRLLKMPHDRNIENYFHKDWDGTLRWPIGWPCEVVKCLQPDQAPRLRYIVERIHGANSFQPYVKRLQNGPFKLDTKVAHALEKEMNISE